MRKALPDVGSHRIRLNQKATLNERTAAERLEDILRRVPEPKPGEKY